MPPRARGLAAALLLLGTITALPAGAVEPPPPVRAVGPERLTIDAAEGSGVLPLYLSKSWSEALPSIVRAVVVVHGLARDADNYLASTVRAMEAAGMAGQGSLIVVPQFLADEDIAAHGLPPAMLHWYWDDWSGGAAAHGPIPLSSFAVIDAVLARLADRRAFPALASVVVMGYSAGGQVVQRYAVVGKGEAALAAAGVRTRYVVGSPSSYLYFGPERVGEGGKIGAFAGAAACPTFDRWKYGLAGDLPAYVGEPPAMLERRYAQREVIYLLGTADSDPHHAALDISCGAEAQGPHRYARGLAYFQVMRARNPDRLNQKLWEAPGIAHESRRVLSSACGLAALFDRTGCLGG